MIKNAKSSSKPSGRLNGIRWWIENYRRRNGFDLGYDEDVVGAVADNTDVASLCDRTRALTVEKRLIPLLSKCTPYFVAKSELAERPVVPSRMSDLLLGKKKQRESFFATLIANVECDVLKEFQITPVELRRLFARLRRPLAKWIIAKRLEMYASEFCFQAGDEHGVE